MDIAFEELKGLTLKSVEGLIEQEEQVTFKTECGRVFNMYHYQDCCENVYISDVCGDVGDIIGSEILHAEERVSDMGEEAYESGTFTFYDIQTRKGSVNIRWNGESNGYYSESVSFVENEKGE